MAFTKEEDGISSEKEFFRNEGWLSIHMHNCLQRFNTLDLLTCAPGMPRGLPFSLSVKKPSVEDMKPASDLTAIHEGIDFDSTDLFDLMDFVGGGELAT